jgi:hypothetical protein
MLHTCNSNLQSFAAIVETGTETLCYFDRGYFEVTHFIGSKG